MAIDPDVFALARQSGGVVTRGALLETGRSRHWVDREVRAGRLTPLKPGVYRVFPADGHDDLLRGAMLALSDAVASHESAAHLLRFPLLPRLVPTVTVPSRTTHWFPGVMVRRTDDLTDQHILSVNGIATTNLMRTVFDLAGVLSETLIDEIIEALVLGGRLHLTTFGPFAESLSRRGKRGSTVTRSIIERRLHNGGVSATALERKGLELLRSNGLPEPVLEFSAPWDGDERIDAAWPAARLGIEWDSKAWHSRYLDIERDRRRDRLAATAGWVVLRYTWADLTERPDDVVNEVVRLLAERRPA